MERPPALIRDYGLSLLLLLASAALIWRTLVPQIRRNLELDDKYRQLLEQNDAILEQNRRLLLLEQAKNDPLLLERVYRLYFGDPPPGRASGNPPDSTTAVTEDRVSQGEPR